MNTLAEIILCDVDFVLTNFSKCNMNTGSDRFNETLKLIGVTKNVQLSLSIITTNSDLAMQLLIWYYNSKNLVNAT